MSNSPKLPQASSKSKTLFTTLQTTLAVTGGLVTLAVGVWQLVDYSGVNKRAQFFCGKDVINGAPITAFLHPSRGEVIVIRWGSSYFKEAGFDPQRRCQEVSPKFQQYREQGKLQYLTTGRKNGSNIICVAESDQAPCLNDRDQGQLWTLKPDTKPNDAIEAITSIWVGGDKPKVLVESQQTWVKVDDLLGKNPTNKI